MANVNTNAGFTNNGGINSYYDVIPGQTITAGNYDQNGLLQVAQSICNTSTGGRRDGEQRPSPTPALPGIRDLEQAGRRSTTIAFGIVFEDRRPRPRAARRHATPGPSRQIGGTTFPSSSASDPTNGYKWCIGTLSARVLLLQQAFANVLNDATRSRWSSSNAPIARATPIKRRVVRAPARPTTHSDGGPRWRSKPPYEINPAIVPSCSIVELHPERPCLMVMGGIIVPHFHAESKSKMSAVLDLHEVTKQYPAGPLGLKRLTSRRPGEPGRRGRRVGRPGRSQPRGQDHDAQARALPLPARPRARSPGSVASAEDRSTLAGVGYVHEAPAFPALSVRPDAARPVRDDGRGGRLGPSNRRVPEIDRARRGWLIAARSRSAGSARGCSSGSGWPRR